MPNLLQQRTLDELVKQYSSLYGLPQHKAFLFLIIEKYLADLQLSSIDIEEAIVDGSDDCGIDAIVIDDENGGFRPNIYFFQSKYYQTEDAFKRQFEGNALEKIQGAVNDFVLQGKINKKYQNQRLVDKLHSVKNLQSKNPKYIIVLCSNSGEPSFAAKSRLGEFIEDSNESGDEYLRAEYIHLDRIANELIAPQQKRKVNLKMQVSGKYLTEDTGNVRLFVGTVEAKELVSLVSKYGDDLFERNIRGGLKRSNQVNKGISQTASGSRSPYFVYMNNGLTITCKKFTHVPINNSPKLDIENAQIVNGQQTARTLYQEELAKKLKDDVKVLVRIVETTDSDLLMQIIEATNSQTKVTSRDLHSNDEVQKLIEENLAAKGYFYEARKDKYKGKEVSKRVDAETAAQSYYAIFFEQPAVAKDKKKLLFGDKYEELFNDETNPCNILYSFRILRAVQKLNNKTKYSTKFTFLTDATLHLAALIHRLSIEQTTKQIDLDNNSEFEKKYKEVVKAIAILVKERSIKEGDKYEHRRTFKDPETYGRALEILLS